MLEWMLLSVNSGCAVSPCTSSQGYANKMSISEKPYMFLESKELLLIALPEPQQPPSRKGVTEAVATQTDQVLRRIQAVRSLI